MKNLAIKSGVLIEKKSGVVCCEDFFFRAKKYVCADFGNLIFWSKFTIAFLYLAHIVLLFPLSRGFFVCKSFSVDVFAGKNCELPFPKF